MTLTTAVIEASDGDGDDVEAADVPTEVHLPPAGLVIGSVCTGL